LARTNNWNDTTTYTNVANTLRGFARNWLFATVEMLNWTGDQEINLRGQSHPQSPSQAKVPMTICNAI